MDNPLYRYSCYQCDAEYISEDSTLKYCNSETCVDKDIKLYGPYFYDEYQDD